MEDKILKDIFLKQLSLRTEEEREIIEKFFIDVALATVIFTTINNLFGGRKDEN